MRVVAFLMELQIFTVYTLPTYLDIWLQII